MRTIPIDTGFIVYNERAYPNLTALFDHLGVATEDSQMSFSASVNDGRFEYSGSGLKGLLAQKRNLVRPRFWNMVWDILRFYRECVEDAKLPENMDLNSRRISQPGGFIVTAFCAITFILWPVPFGRPHLKRFGRIPSPPSFGFSRTTACLRRNGICAPNGER